MVLMLERPEIDGADLMAGLEARLPAYMLPRHVRYFDALPLNSNGKLDRPKMRELYLERR